MKRTYTLLTGFLSLLLITPSTFAVAETLTYEQEVTKVINQKLITENPTTEANKCEVLVVMQRAFNWQIDKSDETIDQFDDTDTWCEPYTKFATANNLIQGRSATQLGLDTPVSRYEVATILYRELLRQNFTLQTNTEVQFTEEMPDWAKEAVEKLAMHGIVKGLSPTEFKGNNGVLKQDLGVMLLRLNPTESNTETPTTEQEATESADTPNPNPEVTEEELATDFESKTYLGFTEADASNNLSAILTLNYDKDNSAIYTESNYRRDDKATYKGTFKELKSPKNLIAITVTEVNGQPAKDLKTIEFLVEGNNLKLNQANYDFGKNGLTLKPDTTFLNQEFTWQNTKEGTKTLESSKVRTPYTATFNSDGRLYLKTDCNSFNANYTLLPANEIIIYDFAGTKKACLNSIENEYIQPFVKAKSYTLTSNNLTITLESGQINFTK